MKGAWTGSICVCVRERGMEPRTRQDKRVTASSCSRIIVTQQGEKLTIEEVKKKKNKTSSRFRSLDLGPDSRPDRLQISISKEASVRSRVQKHTNCQYPLGLEYIETVAAIRYAMAQR
jgi:hypothetical protein